MGCRRSTLALSLTRSLAVCKRERGLLVRVAVDVGAELVARFLGKVNLLMRGRVATGMKGLQLIPCQSDVLVTMDLALSCCGLGSR